MALSISNHSLLTTTLSGTSTTGTLTASAGDLAICVLWVVTSASPGTVTGGGLTWVMASEAIFSINHTQVYVAPVYAGISAQTITTSIPGSNGTKGALLAVTGGSRIGKLNGSSNLGTTTMTRTTITTNNGSLVVGLFSGSTDTVISAGATQLDNNGASVATASANSSPFIAGSSVAITATSAGGNLVLSSAFEVIGANFISINRGLRPHPFSPGLAR